MGSVSGVAEQAPNGTDLFAENQELCTTATKETKQSQNNDHKVSETETKAGSFQRAVNNWKKDQLAMNFLFLQLLT